MLCFVLFFSADEKPISVYCMTGFLNVGFSRTECTFLIICSGFLDTADARTEEKGC